MLRRGGSVLIGPQSKPRNEPLANLKPRRESSANLNLGAAALSALATQARPLADLTHRR